MLLDTYIYYMPSVFGFFSEIPNSCLPYFKKCHSCFSSMIIDKQATKQQQKWYKIEWQKKETQWWRSLKTKFFWKTESFYFTFCNILSLLSSFTSLGVYVFIDVFVLTVLLKKIHVQSKAGEYFLNYSHNIFIQTVVYLLFVCNKRAQQVQKCKHISTTHRHTHTNVHTRAAIHTNEWSSYECGVESLRSAQYTTIHKQ